MKKKIVVFTGAGVSRESGILTFRDSVDGLWENHKIEDVCTPSGWTKDREKVLNFYNDRRRQLPSVEPNSAHTDLVKLEDKYDVTIVTQNVDDLHERAGSSKILHLHGELVKARGAMYSHKTSPLDNIVEIGYNDIKIGDKCEITGSQLRPHIVWFEEYPFNVEESYEAMTESDVLIIIGTSLMIGYTLNLLSSVSDTCKIYYIDPSPSKYLDKYGKDVTYIEKPATEGVELILKELL
jgi:NAD-dependent deacetylase